MAAKNKPIRINLVEQEGWQDYDTASGDVDYNDHAWEAYKYLDNDLLEGYLNDIAETPVKLKNRKVPKLDLSYEQLQFLRFSLREKQDDRLDTVRQMITDALTWMYETAATPNNYDIDLAMTATNEDVLDMESSNFTDELWEPVVDFEFRHQHHGPKAWTPRAHKFDANEMENQLAQAISFHRQKDHYDRFLEFDFWDMPATKELLKTDPRPETRRRLEAEFTSFAHDYVRYFFARLKKVMANIDIEQRADWRESWKSMLKDAFSIVEARKGMEAVLKEMPEDWDE